MADDVGSVVGEVAWMRFARGDWAVETRTRTVLTSTPSEFRLHASSTRPRVSRACYNHSATPPCREQVPERDWLDE